MALFPSLTVPVALGYYIRPAQFMTVAFISVFTAPTVCSCSSAAIIETGLPEFREHDGLPQIELAEQEGVTRRTINTTERERYDLSLKLVFAFVDRFDHCIEDIFTPDTEMNT